MISESAHATKDKPRPQPRVSIGLPVYHGARHLAEALESLLAQTFRDFELIVSDNCSTDGTDDICRSYAQKDERIRYVRQPSNIGAASNFDAVLRLARGELFMWASHDDSWSPTLLEERVAALDRAPSAVGCSSPASFGESPRNYAGAGPYDNANVFVRRVAYLLKPGPNAVFYSLYRRSALETMALKNYEFLGGDWAFVFDLLGKGPIVGTRGAGYFYKRAGGAGAYVESGGRDWRYPFGTLQDHCASNSRWPGSWIYQCLVLKNGLYVMYRKMRQVRRPG